MLKMIVAVVDLATLSIAERFQNAEFFKSNDTRNRQTAEQLAGLVSIVGEALRYRRRFDIR
jgi:hypothetical protein